MAQKDFGNETLSCIPDFTWLANVELRQKRGVEMMDEILQLRNDRARLRVENARLRATLAWAWFAIAAITLMGCYVLLVAYQMEVCR